ncbi:hypothetical protein [Marinicella sp. W31]|uniref:hypothetical protein n=1 Tax=Marinicella sp. W31 TaxID=3023713 RepID=UPI0037575D3E
MKTDQMVEILQADGTRAEMAWQPEWDRLRGLPPQPANPLNDCAKMNHPKGGLTCDQGGCRKSCGMYTLDLDNPAEWEEVDWPLKCPKKNHVYICRCR